MLLHGRRDATVIIKVDPSFVVDCSCTRELPHLGWSDMRDAKSLSDVFVDDMFLQSGPEGFVVSVQDDPVIVIKSLKTVRKVNTSQIEHRHERFSRPG